jgi:hypothetical protein
MLLVAAFVLMALWAANGRDDRGPDRFTPDIDEVCVLQPESNYPPNDNVDYCEPGEMHL